MVRYTILIIFLSISLEYLYAQPAAIRKLPYNINKPSLHVSHPFISGDGESMIYLSNYSDDGSLSMYWTRKKGAVWQDGLEVNRLVNRNTLNLQGAFSLNYEGDLLIVSSQKSGLGGFDLWYSELKNGDWSELKNFGAPINSNQNEGGAVVTSDGKGLYLTRCETMDTREAGGCKIFFAEKKYGRWQEPQALPENINSHNPQFPRILADGETLIFSSNAGGGKGGYDLYSARKVSDHQWSDPVNLAFANTPGDDRFVSVPAKGRYLYKAQMGDRNMEIVQLLFPEELKPRGVYRVNGTIKNANGEPVVANLQIININTRKRVIAEKTENDGSFSFVLVEGFSYDVSLEPTNNGLQYFAKHYELKEIPTRDRETLNIVAEAIAYNTPVVNENLTFEPNTAKLSERSIFEIRRLAALMRANSDLKIKISSQLYHYREDSLVSDEDLTEIRMDTLKQALGEIIPSDHLETSIQDTIYIDSLETNGAYFTNEADTLMILIEADSIHMENSLKAVSIPSYSISFKTIYHNDRTSQEAEAIKSALIDHGVEAEKIITEGIVHTTEYPGEKTRTVKVTLMN